MNRLTNLALLIFTLTFSLVAAERGGFKDAFLLPGDFILPQIATGGDGQFGFYMTFELVNITAQPASAQIQFFDQAANAMPLDLVVDSVLTTTATLTKAVAGDGISFARTFPTGSTRIGYARVTSMPPGSIAVSSTFNQAVPGRPLFQTFIPLSSALHQQFSVPAIDSGAFTPGLAVVTLVAQNLTFSLHDSNGVLLCSSTKAFEAGRHSAFQIPSDPELSCGQGLNTVLKVVGEKIGLTGIVVNAQDDGAFSTQPVYGPIP